MESSGNLAARREIIVFEQHLKFYDNGPLASAIKIPEEPKDADLAQP